jgi:hypothetical protein
VVRYLLPMRYMLLICSLGVTILGPLSYPRDKYTPKFVAGET